MEEFESALDAPTIGQKAVRLGLVSAEQLAEAWEELGAKEGEAEPLLRVLERKGYLTPWQSLKLLKNDNDGFFLGGYRILYKVASGTFGRVYRADNPHTGRIVAVKVLRKKWSDNKHSIELFEREGRVGMNLVHPNLVEIISVNRDPATNQYFIVMEFVEGGDLRDILDIQKKLEPREALRILDDCAQGLAYAYSKGITHRDMKLTNILISTQKTAKLVDFGLAGAFGLALLRDKTEVDRTVDYAGLEKATGVLPGDIRSDIFFLGCVTYHMLTGRSPLLMSRDPRVRMSVDRFKDLKPMPKEEVNAPLAVFHLVETMMHMDPKVRYQTPTQLLDAIRKVRREMEAGEGPGSKKGPGTLFVAERDERLQDVMREKFKELGFRVLIASDPLRAIDRFRQQPFDALIIDAGTTGDDGIEVFERVLKLAADQGRSCSGILMLADEQKDLQDRIQPAASMAVMLHPVKLKQLARKLQDLLGMPASP